MFIHTYAHVYINTLCVCVYIYIYVCVCVCTFIYVCYSYSFLGGLVVRNLPANAGGTGLIPGSGRAYEVGNGNSLQYSCLANSVEEETGGLQSMESQSVGHD